MSLPKILQPFYCPDLIRLGKDNDGGYLVNKEDVLKSAQLLTLGIGDDISFEEDFVKINDCPIEAYDGTIENNFEFFLKPNRNLNIQNIGDREGHKKIRNILSDSDRNVFLKCDIESAEYEILEDLIIHSNKFSGMVLEFHRIDIYALFNLMTNFISKADLKLVHTHVNNSSYIQTPTSYIPDCVELTFTSSRNISLHGATFPHRLDMPNQASHCEFRLIFE